MIHFFLKSDKLFTFWREKKIIIIRRFTFEKLKGRFTFLAGKQKQK